MGGEKGRGEGERGRERGGEELRETFLCPLVRSLFRPSISLHLPPPSSPSLSVDLPVDPTHGALASFDQKRRQGTPPPGPA